MRKSVTVILGVLAGIGAATLVIILTLALQILVARLELRSERPQLARGVVAGYCADDGHTTYTDWDLGPVILRFPHGSGETSYWVYVTDGIHSDVWEIRKEDYGRYEIGRAVDRDQFE